MDLKCSLTTKLKKDGTPYEVIVIKLTDTYEKLVFLEQAEKELLKLAHKQESTINNPYENV